MNSVGLKHIPPLPPIEEDARPHAVRKQRNAKDPDRRPFRSTVILDVGIRRNLDEMTVALRSPTGSKFSDSAIMRAAIRALYDAGLDLSGIRTEEDLRKFLQKRLRR